MRAGTTPNGQPRSTALYEAICGWIIWTIVFDFLRISAL